MSYWDGFVWCDWCGQSAVCSSRKNALPWPHGWKRYVITVWSGRGSLHMCADCRKGDRLPKPAP